MRVGLIGEFGAGNFGNEASVAAELAALRDVGDGVLGAGPGVAPTLVATDPAAASALHGVPAVALVDHDAPRGGVRGLVGKLYDARHAWRVVGGQDALVIPGTGIFEGLAVNPGAIPLTLFWYALAARLRRRPLLVLSVGADGVGGPLLRFLVRWTLRLATYVSVRDGGSAARVAGLGAPMPAVVPDLVLGVPAEGDDPGSGPGAGHEALPSVAVGVVNYLWCGPVRTAQARDRYEERTLALVSALVAAGLDVRVVGGDEGDDETVARVVDAAAATGAGDHVTAVLARSLDDVESVLRSSAAMVAVRYHNLIGAVRAGVPMVSLGYGPKQRWLLERFGLERFAHDLGDFDPAEVARQVVTLAREPREQRAAIRPALAAVRAEIAAQDALVLRLLTERRGTDAAGRPAEAPAHPLVKEEVA